MELSLKAELKKYLQKFLDEHETVLQESMNVWFDESAQHRNADLLVNACECVLEAAALQSALHDEIVGE